MTIRFVVELANKIERGRAVGNLWGVARYVDGRRHDYLLQPQPSEQRARDCAAIANEIATSDRDAIEARIRERVVYTLATEFEDDVTPEDSFQFPEDVALVRAGIAAGNEWAWFRATVTAQIPGLPFRGRDHLGACSYDSGENFKQPNGYYDDMKHEALRALVDEIAASVEALRAVGFTVAL